MHMHMHTCSHATPWPRTLPHLFALRLGRGPLLLEAPVKARVDVVSEQRGRHRKHVGVHQGAAVAEAQQRGIP